MPERRPGRESDVRRASVPRDLCRRGWFWTSLPGGCKQIIMGWRKASTVFLGVIVGSNALMWRNNRKTHEKIRPVRERHSELPGESLRPSGAINLFGGSQ